MEAIDKIRDTSTSHERCSIIEVMGAYAVELLCQGKTNRVVASKDGQYVDYDIDEALAMKKSISEFECTVCQMLSI